MEISGKKNRYWTGAYAVILAAAAAVRFWDLGHKSLWLDESWSLRFSLDSVSAILNNTAETNPPLYHLVQHFQIAWLGTSEWALRLPAAGFGVIAVVLMERLASMTSGKRVGLMAMALMALSPLPLMQSQNARTFTLFLSLTLASYLCLHRWLRKPSWALAAGYAAAVILQAYSHYYWVFNALAQNLYVLIRARRQRNLIKPWLMINVLILAACFPWLIVLFRQARQVASGFWIPAPTIDIIAGTVVQYVLWWQAVPVLFFLFPALLAVLGLFRFQNRLGQILIGRPRWRRDNAFLLLWFLCPLVVPLVWSFVSQPIYWDRYTIAATAPFYIFIARGMMALPRRFLRIAAAGGLVILALAGLPWYHSWQMEDWRQLSYELRERLAYGDKVVIPEGCEPIIKYYFNGEFNTFRGRSKDIASGRAKDDLQHLSQGARRLFIVWRGRWTRKPSLISRALDQSLPGSVPVKQEYFGSHLVLNIRHISP